MQNFDNADFGKEKTVSVKEAQFPRFDNNDQITSDFQQNEEEKHIDLLMDVPLQVHAEIGKTKKTMREIMELCQGSIVVLGKQAGAPVDIIVNKQTIARGNVIVSDDKFSVRLTEIVSSKH